MKIIIFFYLLADDDDKCIFDKMHHTGNISTRKSTFEIVYNESKLPEKCDGRGDRTVMKRRDNKAITMDLWKKRLMLPTSLASKSIAEYMQEEQNVFPWADFNCHLLPRLQFGSSQEMNETILNAIIPDGFHAKNFKTLSFFSYGRKGDIGFNKWAKCIVDVSRIDRIAIQGPHYMAINCSGESKSFIDHDKALLRVNHYVGSWESFIASNDVRRSKEVSYNDFAFFAT